MCNGTLSARGYQEGVPHGLPAHSSSTTPVRLVRHPSADRARVAVMSVLRQFAVAQAPALIVKRGRVIVTAALPSADPVLSTPLCPWQRGEGKRAHYCLIAQAEPPEPPTVLGWCDLPRPLQGEQFA